MAPPVLTANSPTAGYISWTAFTIGYLGANYPVAAGNSNSHYVAWLYLGGSPQIVGSNVTPVNTAADATIGQWPGSSGSPPPLGPDDLLLFINRSGVGINVQQAQIMPGDLIATGTITAANIATGTITANEIHSQTITAAQIATDTITANEINANAIGTSELAATAVTADKVAAGAITADKLTIGSVGNNLILNSTMEDADTSNALLPAKWNHFEVAGTPVFLWQQAIAGAKSIGITNTSANGGAYGSAPFPVTPGQTLFVSVQVKASATSGSNVYVRLRYYSDQGITALTATPATPTNQTAKDLTTNTVVVPTASAFAGTAEIAQSWVPNTTNTWLVSGQSVVPTGAVWAELALYNWTGTGATVYFDTAQVMPVVVSASIANGAVTANQIAANTITGSNIAGSTITGTNIAGSTITGGNIAANTITAGNIAANTITTSQLNANAINGMTITSNNINSATINSATINSTTIIGGTFQTGTSAPFIEISSSSVDHILFIPATSYNIAPHIQVQNYGGAPVQPSIVLSAGTGVSGAADTYIQVIASMTSGQYGSIFLTGPTQHQGGNFGTSGQMSVGSGVLNVGDGQITKSSGTPFGFNSGLSPSGDVNASGHLNGTNVSTGSGVSVPCYIATHSSVTDFRAWYQGGTASLVTGSVCVFIIGGSNKFQLAGGATVNSGTKSFVIDHPTDKAKYLVHACIEGPEDAVFYRGKGQLVEGMATVTLPDYFTDLCDEETATIQVQPVAQVIHDHHGHIQRGLRAGSEDDPCLVDGKQVPHHTHCHAFTETPNLVVSPVVDGQFVVGRTGGFAGPQTADAEFYWEVKARRKDVPVLEVEPVKSQYELRGDGPYTYLVRK